MYAIRVRVTEGDGGVDAAAAGAGASDQDVDAEGHALVWGRWWAVASGPRQDGGRGAVQQPARGRCDHRWGPRASAAPSRPVRARSSVGACGGGGARALEEGDLEKARRLAEKGHEMFPTPASEKLVAETVRNEANRQAA